jgi:hypothetical protein
VKVENHSSDDIEITHIWFDTNPQVHILSHRWPLPARIRPKQTYETWCPITDLPQIAGIEELARVKLSTRRKPLKSKPNRHVPPFGAVAGPPSS